jgi:hypothetical protein
MERIPTRSAQLVDRQLVSRLCTSADFNLPWFQKWRRRFTGCKASGIELGGAFLHRKEWEYVSVCAALERLGVLRAGARGIGFAVGAEPLPEIFAGLGCHITATDILVGRDSVPARRFNDERSGGVERRQVDMRRLPNDLRGFDFSWSCCALEHLGSLELGAKFIMDQFDCLNEAGVAIHTLEFNLDSNDETVVSGPTVVFRRRDIDSIAADLEKKDIRLSPCDFMRSNSPEDEFVAVVPYHSAARNLAHLCLKIQNFTATSFILVMRKRAAAAEATNGPA